MLIPLYASLVNTLFPIFSGFYLRKRLKKKKEIAERLQERKGVSTLSRPRGSLIWIHCASVGEANSILILIERIHQAHPSFHFLVTTGTVTSAALMNQNLPSYAIHQFNPLDVTAWVNRFLDHWSPNLILWVESELWPNTLLAIQNRRIPLLLVNARMSDRSYKKWSSIKSTAERLLKSFSLILTQSGESAERFMKLGASAVSYTGNLKFAAPPLPCRQEDLKAFQKACEGRRILLFASTHPGEEEKAIEVRNNLISHKPNLLTIIAPRHPHRTGDIAQILNLHGVVEYFSSKKPPSPSCDFYIIDTIGELGLFYRLSSVVFIGGSWIPRGGHNPIEPAQLMCALFHGPHIHNFREVYKLFEESQSAQLVKTPLGFADHIRTLLNDPNRLHALQMRAFELVTRHQKSLDRVMEALSPSLKNLRQEVA